MLRRARAWASAEITRLLHAEVLDARAELETVVHSRVTELADGIDRDTREREQALSSSLDRVADALDAVAAQLAEQAHDHRASVAALELLVREVALAFVPPIASRASTVIGGTIDPETIDVSAIEPPTVDVVADRTEDAPVELAVGVVVEVRSRFQNRWVDGFEVVEVVVQGGVERYRLARHADHVQLPALFDAADLRPFDVVDEIVIEPDVDELITAQPDDPGSRR